MTGMDFVCLAPDGSTRVGDRAATAVPAKTQIAVESYDPTDARAMLSTPDDRVAAFLPGATFTAPEIWTRTMFPSPSRTRIRPTRDRCRF